MIQFTNEDLLLFSAASGDSNPLHMSAEYAAHTSYGAQVVFGALGALAALGGVAEEQSRRIRGMQVDFLRPIFLGVNYRRQNDGLRARLFDGSSSVVSVTLTLGEVWPDRSGHETRGEFLRAEAVTREDSELKPGLIVKGRYATNSSAREQLRRQWGVTATAGLVDVLLWSSYLVGMEIPGKSALFSRLSLEFIDSSEPGPFEYEATVEQVDQRLGQLRICGQLRRAKDAVATAECRAFHRPPSPALDSAALALQLTPSHALAGKKALVIGASRGLGLALVSALASQRAEVIGASRSAGMDATDGRWRAQFCGEHRKLDLLILNAFPALLPLPLEENACERIEAFMQKATAMTVGPLCSFLGLLSASQGTAVLISSVAVEKPVKEWPHYVAAKKAAEALMEVAAMQYPDVGFLVVRAEKMRTEMTNTPLGRRNAAPPEQVAMRIVRQLLQGVTGYQLLR